MRVYSIIEKCLDLGTMFSWENLLFPEEAAHLTENTTVSWWCSIYMYVYIYTLLRSTHPASPLLN